MDISICNATMKMIDKARQDGVETIWDRLQQQKPECAYGLLGTCCRTCNMGPCRIEPFGNAPRKGVCGATADTIVARNLLTNIATGAAAHCDHGREVIQLLKHVGEEKTSSFKIHSSEKLKKIASEFGISIEGHSNQDICCQLADRLLQEFGRQTPGLFPFFKRVPEKRLKLWKELNVLPRGIDREIVESLHRAHIGVDNEATSLLLQAIRTALTDGWAGSMIATEISDILFGIPQPRQTTTNLGVLKENMVNIIIHGHEPLLSEMIVQASMDNKLHARALANGSEGVNICAMCCTGNEMLMRHGVKLAGNFLQQELAIVTGAVEAMVVDVQCILPSLGDLTKCYHTKFISTSPKAHFPNAIKLELDENNALDTAYKIIETAIDNFQNRKKSLVSIPKDQMTAIAGFSVEALEMVLGDDFKILTDAIASGTIKGVAAVVGCNNPKSKHDYGHVAMIDDLLKSNILVLTTGCTAIACAKAGFLTMQAADIASSGLCSVCKELTIPPVLHLGSCVDISRILTIAAKIATTLNCDIADLPLAAAAPEWMSQKALAIGTYVISSGIYTVLGNMPPVLGSSAVKDILLRDVEKLLGAKFAVEFDPHCAASLMISHIEQKRRSLLGESQLTKSNC